MNRFLLFGILTLVGLVVLSYTTAKTFRVEVFVPAPPESVWAVLVNTDAYADWNPVFVQVDGTYEAGGSVISHVLFPNGEVQTMSVSVDTVIPGRELRQSGGFPGFITFDHRWILDPTEGGTKVVQEEIDRGLYLWFWDSSWIIPSYQAVSDALKQRVIENERE